MEDYRTASPLENSWIHSPVSLFGTDIEDWDYSEILSCDDGMVEEYGGAGLCGVAIKDLGTHKPQKNPTFTSARSKLGKVAGMTKAKIQKGLQYLKKSKTSLKKEIRHHTAENRELQALNQEKQQEVFDLQTVVDNNKGAISVLCEDLRRQKAQDEAIIAQLQQEKTDTEKWNLQLKIVVHDLQAVEKNCVCNHCNISEAEMHKKTIKDLEGKLRMQKEASDTEISTLRSANHDLSVAKTALENDVGLLKKEVQETKVENAKLRSQDIHCQLHHRDVSAMQEKTLTQHETIIQGLETNFQESVSTFETQMMTVQADQEEKIASQGNIIQDYAEVVPWLKSENNKLQDSRKILEDEVSCLEDELQTEHLSSTRAALQDTCLYKNNADLKEETSQTEIAELKTTIENLNQEKTTKSTINVESSEELLGKIKFLNSLVAQRDAEIALLKQREEQTHLRLMESQELILQIRSQVEEFKRKIIFCQTHHCHRSQVQKTATNDVPTLTSLKEGRNNCIWDDENQHDLPTWTACH